MRQILFKIETVKWNPKQFHLRTSPRLLTDLNMAKKVSLFIRYNRKWFMWYHNIVVKKKKNHIPKSYEWSITWIGSLDISLSINSWRAKLKSGTGSSPVGLRRGQLTLKKWLLPHRRRSPWRSSTRDMTGDPFRKQGELPRGSINSCPFSITSWQCSAWIPNPHSWISGCVSASCLPTNVRSCSLQ